MSKRLCFIFSAIILCGTCGNAARVRPQERAKASLSMLAGKSVPSLAGAEQNEAIPEVTEDALDDGWDTVHEIDALKSAEMGNEFHTEENCPSCMQGDILLPPELSPPPSYVPPNSLQTNIRRKAKFSIKTGLKNIVKPASCRNDNRDCAGWQRAGQCEKNRRYMHANCRAACGRCQVDASTCRNEEDQCEQWANKGECTNNPKFMRSKCSRACGFCETGDRAWLDGIVWFKWKHGIRSEVKNVTTMAMVMWERRTCVRFKEASSNPRSHSERYPVEIGSDKPGCNAHTGFQGQSYQNMNLGKGCEHVGTALHELGHVLGLSHEHERFDREKYVSTHMQNVETEMRKWFEVTPWRSPQARVVPYDLSSIMHYDAWAFARNKNYTDASTATITVKSKDDWGNCRIGQRVQPSAGDVETIAVMYGCPKKGMRLDAHRDETCTDSPQGYRNIPCRSVLGRRFADGLLYCDTIWVQKECPRSCAACPSKPFC